MAPPRITAEVRPYKPWEPDDPTTYGTCGRGKDKQVDIHDDKDKVIFLSPYARGHHSHFPELTKLSKKINALLKSEGIPAVRAERKKSGVRNLELTIVIDKKGFHLVYAVSRRRRTPR